MKEIGIQINSDLEIYCLFSRYKISDDYEVISVDLLEKELENFQINRINQIGQNNIGEQVIENVEEENEDNTLNWIYSLEIYKLFFNNIDFFY